MCDRANTYYRLPNPERPVYLSHQTNSFDELTEIKKRGAMSRTMPKNAVPAHGNEVWPAIDAVARALLLNGELTGQEVRDIANHATPSH